MEAGGSRVQGKSHYIAKFEAILGYPKFEATYLKNKQASIKTTEGTVSPMFMLENKSQQNDLGRAIYSVTRLCLRLQVSLSSLADLRLAVV